MCERAPLNNIRGKTAVDYLLRGKTRLRNSRVMKR